MANSLVGYITLLRQLPFFCKGWVGDHCRNRSICSRAYMYSRGWGEPTPPIYIVYTIYTLLDLAPPKQNFWVRQWSRDRYIPPKKIPPRKVPPGKFLLWKIPPTSFRSYVVSELARFARGRIEDSSFTGSRSTTFQNCLPHCFLA